MLLWTREKLCYTCCKLLGENEIFASKQMLTNQKHQDLNQIGEQGNLLECKVVYCGQSANVGRLYETPRRLPGFGVTRT